MKFPFTKKNEPQTTLPRDGILFGYPRLPNDLNNFEYIDAEALNYHSLVVGKPGNGKTTLLKLLSIAAMERDMSLIVFDARGDLSFDLLGYVPARRVNEATYFDLGDSRRGVGLNVLDPMTASSDSTIVDAVLQANELLWKQKWNLSQEDFWRASLYTLLAINRHLRQEDRPLFTLLDVIALFELPTFRRRLLNQYLDETELGMWWTHHFEPMPNWKRNDLTSAFLAQVRPLAADATTRNILGHSHAAINFRDLVCERRITLINLAQPYLPYGIGAWFGRILSQLLLGAALERRSLIGTQSAYKLLVVFTGFQPVPLIEQMHNLPHSDQHGIRFLFGLDSLAQLNQSHPSVSHSLLANVGNLFVFQTTHQDAEPLSGELCADLKIADLVGLPHDVCYARTKQGGATLPTRRVKMMPPLALESAATRDQVLHRMRDHTHPAYEIAEARRKFEQTWHGREDALFRQIMSDSGIKREPREKPGEDKCQP